MASAFATVVAANWLPVGPPPAMDPSPQALADVAAIEEAAGDVGLAADVTAALVRRAFTESRAADAGTRERQRLDLLKSEENGR